jgi:type I restriction enzyme M protein
MGAEMPKRHAVGNSARSAVGRVEELVLAGSGADAFELVFSLVAARLGGARLDRGRADLVRGLRRAAARWPGLEASPALDVSDAVLAQVTDLLGRAALDGDAEGLDAVFEQLVTRVGKGDKGQFFTPRHVVDWIARVMLLAPGERVLDPACGSGAFLAHARAHAAVEAHGRDVDRRAVRVARLLAIATGADPGRIVRADSLRREAPPPPADVVLTNPPFAGDATHDGYEVAAIGRRAERDALFLERCLELLRPGGRLAIVLPHSKVAADGWGALRRWLVERARVFAVVGLPRETFLPHTSQKTAVLFAKRRERPRTWRELDVSERTLFAVSERAGKAVSGEPLAREGGPARSWREVDHDLDAITPELIAFLRREGFADHARARRDPPRSRTIVRTLAELGDAVTLAPERHRVASSGGAEGVPLGALVTERADRVLGPALGRAVVFDTTHAKDGLLDVRSAERAASPPSSPKKLVGAGDLLVSRLRPYLRQIALAHRSLAEECGARTMACSTEFYVLSPKEGESLAFLLPWLLSAEVQALLAAAQEGGHHPRVPRATLLALRVPRSLLRSRQVSSARIERGIADLLSARRALSRLLSPLKAE